MIFKTLAISNLETSDIAQQILARCAYLSADDISEDLFLHSIEDTNECREAVRQLLALSLIKKDERTSLFSIHRLLQMVIRNELEKNVTEQGVPQAFLELTDYVIKDFQTKFTCADDYYTMQRNRYENNYYTPFMYLDYHASRLKISSERRQALEWICIISRNYSLKKFAFLRHQEDLCPLPSWLAQLAHQDQFLPFDIGSIYEDFKNPNYTESSQWFQVARTNGFSGIELDIALAYEEQENTFAATKWHLEGLRKDDQETVNYLTNLDKHQDDILAKFMLFSFGYHYFLEEEKYKDIVSEFESLNNSAEKDEDAEAQWTRGMLYAFGLGIEKNEIKALKWLSSAAVQGHKEALKCLEAIAQEDENSDAYFVLGTLYANGVGVEKNPTKTLKWGTKKSGGLIMENQQNENVNPKVKANLLKILKKYIENPIFPAITLNYPFVNIY